jgi:sialic acid synthase SpsE
MLSLKKNMSSNRSFKIGKNYLNDKTLPYIIAEIGVNHETSITQAKKMILLAKKSGLNAVKFQTYKAENLVIKNSPAYWDIKKEKTTSQYKLFKKLDKFDNKDYLELYNYSKKIKIDFLSTPFDLDSVDFLKKIVPAFKIASADINNFPLLKKISLTKKPIILSTGASTIKEIQAALKILKKNGSKNISILHCILNYPTINKHANLKMITSLRKLFPNNLIGYSDHTLPDSSMLPCLTAYQLGARIIEKHFTFNKKLKGNDHYHSMDYKDAKNLILQIKNYNSLLGTAKKKSFIYTEKKSRKFARRSIVSLKDIRIGEVFSNLNITTKRPGTGVSPMLWPKLIGKKAKNNIKEDKLIKLGDF